MVKVMGIAAIVSAWIAMGFDIVRRNDAHLDKVTRCMREVRHASNATPHEAYILCESK
jgi:hypothetical protein